MTSAERSFWEKAKILHQQAHRPTPMPPRYSRHYYDLHKLAGSPVCDAALADLALLQDGSSFKRRFYPSAWATYETARPRSLKLIPGAEHLAFSMTRLQRHVVAKTSPNHDPKCCKALVSLVRFRI